MSLVEQFFSPEHSFVITCDEKRYKVFRAIFDYYKLPQPTKFNACKLDHPANGCLLSHYTLMKMAQTLDLPYITVFEDDLFPRKNIIEYLERALAVIPHKAWNLLKLEDTYWDEYKNFTNLNAYWRVGTPRIGGSGTGCYIASKAFYTRYIKLCEMFDLDGIKYPADAFLNCTDIRKLGKNFIIDKLCFLQHSMHRQPVIHAWHFNKFDLRIGDNYDPNDMMAFDLGNQELMKIIAEARA